MDDLSLHFRNIKGVKCLFKFTWIVDQAGYAIKQRKGELGLFSDGEPRDGIVPWLTQSGGPIREYRPMIEDVAVHRNLAELDAERCNESDMLNFCNQFGLLKHDWPDNTEQAAQLPFGLRIDSRLGVQPNIQSMRVDEFWFLQAPVKRAVQFLDSGNKLKAAEIFNDQMVNSRVWLEHKVLNGKYELQHVPLNLISAIWFKIEQEISGQRQWPRCPNCQEWFLRKSKKRIYCRDACKVAWSRKKRGDK